MYSLAIRRDFIARHALLGEEPGPESFPHSHHYELELQISGGQLNEHGYLIDRVGVENHLDEVVSYYREQMLNKKPEFGGINPSLENFARILCLAINERITAGNIQTIMVTLWENEDHRAAYEIRK